MSQRSVKNVVCYERRLLWTWSGLNVVCYECDRLRMWSFMNWSVLKWSVMNVVWYELVCYKRSLIWTWSVMNVNWSFMNMVCNERGLLWTGLFWTWSVIKQVCFERTQDLQCKSGCPSERISLTGVWWRNRSGKLSLYTLSKSKGTIENNFSLQFKYNLSPNTYC